MRIRLSVVGTGLFKNPTSAILAEVISVFSSR